MGKLRIDNLFFRSVPWIAAASCVAGHSLGPFRHTGLLWIMSLLSGVVILLIWRDRKICFPWIWWAPLYVYLAASLTWGSFDLQMNLRLYVQMLVFPVVGMVASFAVKSSEDVSRLHRDCAIMAMLIGLACWFFVFGPGEALQDNEKDRYIGFAFRPAATSLVVAAAVFVAQFRQKPFVSLLMWLFSFVVCVVSGSRMASLVTLLLWIVHPRLAAPLTRLTTVVVIAGVGLVAFNTPIIQDRFFKKEHGFSGKGGITDVAKGKFSSAGRFEAWPRIFDKATEQPFFGHGIGESQAYTYKVWSPMDKPHNEYLKMFFEGGIFALALFLLALGGTWLNLVRLVRTADPAGNWPAIAAYLGLFGFALLATVDNPLVYGNNFLHPVFALIGAANGLAVAADAEAQPAHAAARELPWEPLPLRVMLR